jgi:hypothetical protein
MSAMLASTGVGAAAGALIAFSFAMSPPLTLLPSRPSDANGNLSSHRNVEIADASADDFNGRWHEAANGIPPMPTSKSGDSPDLQNSTSLPIPSMMPVQVLPTEPNEFEPVSKPSQDSPVALVVPKPSARPSSVCARNGLYRIEYTRNNHRYWRCLHRQRAFTERRTVSNSNATRVSGQASPGNEPQPFFQALRGFFSFQNTQ